MHPPNFVTLITLNFLHLNNLWKFYGKRKFVWFCYFIAFICTLLFCKQLPVLHVFLLLKIKLFNTAHSAMGKISREDRRVTRVDVMVFGWKSFHRCEFATPTNLQHNRIYSSADKKAHISTSRLRSEREHFSSTYDIPWKIILHQKCTCRYMWRPLVCYTFIIIKLASCHSLLYVVYMCQKS